MTKLTEKMTQKINSLPNEEQDIIASSILDLLNGGQIEEEEEWENLVNSPQSLAWLEKQSEKIQSDTEKVYDFDPANIPHDFQNN